MALTGFGLKSAAVVAALLLLGACETPGEEKADTSGGGGSAVTSTTSQDKGPAMEKKADIVGSQEDLVLNVGDRVFFEYDSSELQPESRDQIERWAGWLKKFPANTVTIEGHCDERGTRE